MSSVRKRKKSKHDSIASTSKRKESFAAPTFDEEEDVSAQVGVVANMAIYRIILFSLMVYEWCTHMPHYPFNPIVRDAWMTYDQFHFFFKIAPKLGEPGAVFYCAVLFYFGILCGVTAALGGITINSRKRISFEVPATLFTLCYAVRFLSLITRFTNHNYLFLLLMILVTLSGGGSLFGHVDTDIIRRCQWGAVSIRFQYAILYLYAFLWKIHWDWLDGTIVRQMMLTFEQEGVSRGIMWAQIEKEFPALFFFIALGGIVLDSGMFFSLTLYRPCSLSRYRFVLLSVMFHGFVCYTMSQRIGYTFPAVCLAGSLMYSPFDENHIKSAKTKKNSKGIGKMVITSLKNYSNSAGDCNLVDWTRRYVRGANGSSTTATLRQRIFTIVWVFFQLIFPLRMVVISGGNFPFTGQGYRFSWTMMLHSREHHIVHKTSTTPPQQLLIQLFYIEPKCNAQDHIYRTGYMPGTEHVMEDSRTLPLFTRLVEDNRSIHAMNVYPRHIARVGGGMIDAFDTFPNTCKKEGGRVTIHATHYAKLNDKGPFSRLIDPTVDLAAAERARRERTFLRMWHDVILDVAPKGHEYLLKGVGSLRNKVMDIHLPKLKKLVNADEYGPEKNNHIEFFADRGACLMRSPLKILTRNFPIMIFLIESPSDATLLNYQGDKAHRLALPIGETPVLHVDSVEISLVKDNNIQGTCGETSKEDVLFAIVFMV